MLLRSASKFDDFEPRLNAGPLDPALYSLLQSDDPLEDSSTIEVDTVYDPFMPQA
jgi:hypothetical protein